MSVDYKLNHQADVFFEQLGSMLKKFPPIHYAAIVSEILNEVFTKRELSVRYPPHFLLHSIQANCIYYNKNRKEELSEKKLQRILNHYKQYFDPVAELYLEKEDGITPFFINMARQQFLLQWGYGGDALGRSVSLFSLGKYPISEKYFKENFGMTFNEWLIIGLAVSAYQSKKSQIISPLYFIKSSEKIAPDNVVESFFRENSISPVEVKKYHEQVEKKIGKNAALFFDTYLNNLFVEKPMLTLNDSTYLVVHKQLFIKKVLEGIFDICKKGIPSEFGVEFGKNFERYIGELLSHFLPSNRIFTEKQMRQFTDKKVCDFMLVLDDYIFLLESKGVEYSSYTASEQAMKGDNSTKKISTGFDQLSSVAKMIREGTFTELIGESNDKKIIASVVTYKQLYLANDDWYFQNNILPLTKDTDFLVDGFFEYRPQILSIHELELLLKHCEEKQRSYFDVFTERLNGVDQFLRGDWYLFLETESNIPFLRDNFDEFFGEVVEKQLKGG
ncbi:hypothetical protein [Paenibacillus elgii]|uniref:hypothetical protein n=1 Tax=Paenibacillus elgii TaxID=189691 RepID=UPI00203F8C77|nr:hypothetical protein [Paenibacillus elgii]MCM3271130.1 hypothetical protein [Paenibacillus elgii]